MYYEMMQAIKTLIKEILMRYFNPDLLRLLVNG